MYDGTYWNFVTQGQIYQVMMQSEASTGTATNERLITAKVLNDTILEKADQAPLTGYTVDTAETAIAATTTVQEAVEQLDYRTATNKTNILLNWTEGKNKLAYTLESLKALNTTGMWSGNSYTVANVKFTLNADKTISVEAVGTVGTATLVLANISDVTLDSGTTYVGASDTTYSVDNYFGLLGGTGVNNYIFAYNPTVPSNLSNYTKYIIRITTNPSPNFTLFKPMVCKQVDYQASSQYFPSAMSNVDLTTLSKQNQTNILSESADIYSNWTSGKNRLQYTLASLKTLNTAGTWTNNQYTRRGVTFTVNADLSITATGTNDGTGDSWLDLASSTTAYTGLYGSGCPAGGSASTYGIQYGGSRYDYGTGITVPSGAVTIGIVIRSGQSAPTAPFKPMICTAAEYQASSEYYPYALPNTDLTTLSKQNQTNISLKASVGDIYGRGTAISNNSDLNNYKTIGRYYADSSSVSATLSNTPITTSGFIMTVSDFYQSANNETGKKQVCEWQSGGTYVSKMRLYYYTSGGVGWQWSAWT